MKESFDPSIPPQRATQRSIGHLTPHHGRLVKRMPRETLDGIVSGVLEALVDRSKVLPRAMKPMGRPWIYKHLRRSWIPSTVDAVLWHTVTQGLVAEVVATTPRGQPYLYELTAKGRAEAKKRGIL